MCFGVQRSLRSLLLYTPCRDVQQQCRLQSLMSPIVNTLLVKCVDPNRSVTVRLVTLFEVEWFFIIDFPTWTVALSKHTVSVAA